MKKAIIVDLDGTLTNVDHRVHHVQSKPKNWKKFNELMVNDKLNHWCAELISAMQSKDYSIVFVTGRDENFRGQTVHWLGQNNIKYDFLYMRKKDDHREDSDVKEELYKQHLKDKFQILFVIDDRKSVVQRWRELELICLQCAPGEF